MKIIFMGTPDYATTILKKLFEKKYEITALFTQPDKPVGRKQILTPPHIKQYIIDNQIDIPVFQPKSLKDQETIDTIKALNADFIIVAAFGQILPKDILDIAPCINLHASLLPAYRGASPIQQSILNGDKYTGVTSMLMDVGLDSGDILGFKYVKIGKDTVVSELFEELSKAASNLTIETLENFKNIKPKKQNLSQVSHCGKVTKQDGLVDFNDAKTFYQKYKAFKTWPDIYLDSGLKIIECELLETNSENKHGGEILEIQKEYITVSCKKGTMKISKLQPQSKKAMSAVDYIRGARLQTNDVLA